MVSRYYISKEWPIVERRAAVERYIQEKGKEYILPIQIDETKLPDIPGTLGYVPIQLGIEKIAALVLQKLGKV